jgi:hypothetical protein
MAKLQFRVSNPDPFAGLRRPPEHGPTPSGLEFGSGGVVAPAESNAPARQPSQALKMQYWIEAVSIVQATVREGESYL